MESQQRAGPLHNPCSSSDLQGFGGVTEPLHSLEEDAAMPQGWLDAVCTLRLLCEHPHTKCGPPVDKKCPSLAHGNEAHKLGTFSIPHMMPPEFAL